MRKFITTFILVVGVSATDKLPAADHALEISDSQISGFDFIAHIGNRHPSLALQAESISHWAAYYDINPLVLTQLLLTEESGALFRVDQVKSLAQRLADLKGSKEALVKRLGWEFDLGESAAGQIFQQARIEAEIAGIPRTQAEADEAPPALDLPFQSPQAWQFNGVHTWTGDNDNSPMSSIDFTSSWSEDWGDDTSERWVTASHDGEVTVFSSCYVHIQHESGWGTRYYHLSNLQVETGQQVKAGELLANYAPDLEQALCSGGKSTGPHLHFALRKDGQYSNLQEVAISGYIVQSGDFSYDTNHSRMWLEKWGTRYFGFGESIASHVGDNLVDYRFNGKWYSAEYNGHGFDITVSEIPGAEGSRKIVAVTLYTYDDNGLANFYSGNRDFERWRSDESITLELIQTQGGNFTDLQAIDFNDPDMVRVVGDMNLWFKNCSEALVSFRVEERDLGLEVEHEIELVKLLGLPDQVCNAESSYLPTMPD